MATDRLRRLDDWLRHDFIEPGLIPGCQLLVARHGEVLAAPAPFPWSVALFAPRR